MGPHLEIKKEEHRKEEMCVEMAGWYLLEYGNKRRLERTKSEQVKVMGGWARSVQPQ